VGIIACVEITTTTAGTTPESTSALSSSIAPTTGAVGGPEGATTTPASLSSGTTVVPTSVATTTVCQKDMATVGGQYVSSVAYSVQPVDGTNSDDLTSTAGNGIDFPSLSGTTGVLDNNNKPIYQITITFNQPGVDSLGSITLNSNSNVDKFAVQFFVPSNPNQPVPLAPELADQPLSVVSTTSASGTSIVNLPAQLPSPISGIRIVILSTKDDQ
jgi:hypothetical protein